MVHNVVNEKLRFDMHTFLSIDLSLLHKNTRNSPQAKSIGMLSNDGSRRVIDGYSLNADGSYKLDVNNDKILVHTDKIMKAWVKIPENAATTQSQILSEAIEYTAAEFDVERNDVNSIWFVGDIL